MIGIVDAEDGLYELKIPSVSSMIVVSNLAFHCNKIHSCNKVPIYLWHYRLGHSSHERLHIMKQHYPILISGKDFVCDTCHKAKQKKKKSFSYKHFTCFCFYIFITCGYLGSLLSYIPAWSYIFFNHCTWLFKICMGFSYGFKS